MILPPPDDPSPDGPGLAAFPDPPGPSTPPDPATPARRLELARSMLVWAIHSYEQAEHHWNVVREGYPGLPAPDWPRDRDLDEHRAWMRLFNQADDAFDGAELALASRIQNLYDALAPAGRRAADDEGDYFASRAVRHRGSVYVLSYDVSSYEPKTNIIVVYPEAMTIDLAD